MKINPPALTAIREGRGWTKSALAVEAQISVQYLCDLEAGRRGGVNPRISKQLAEALQVPVTAITWPVEVAA